ncbi:MAG: methionine adenosyltransferase domain-containing protein [Myxococcota bacterium]|nr:methionine adenosyltransferase domain-containing protein [Myxococcota bacterium]
MKTIAEFILPGHPDKICDRIADLLVDAACARDPRSLVGVEVALHRYKVLVTGCITTSPPMTHSEVSQLVRHAFRDAGYGKEWSPAPEDIKIEFDLRLEELDDPLRHLRSISDDQAICIGYANGHREDNHLPFAHRKAYQAAQRIRRLRTKYSLGPDAKVILTCRDRQVEKMSLSLQHRPNVNRTQLYACAREVGESVGLSDLDRICVNGGGDFDVGGPHGDNGLSGKKLVVDAYGPSIPIGGGAWSGKDPHKVDRSGGLIARYIALCAVRIGLCSEALVQLGWHPGDASPSMIQIQTESGPILLEAIGRFDLTIDGIWASLGLGSVRFSDYADGSWFQKQLFPARSFLFRRQVS